MGCGSSKKIGTALTWETDMIGGRIRKRQGHPTHYRMDGYEFGIRVYARGKNQALYTGTSKANNDKVTIKESTLSTTYTEDMAIEEVMILASLNHPNIIELKEVFVDKDQHIYSIIQYIDPMRLKHFVNIKGRVTNLSIADAKYIAKAINDALIHCHNNKIIVRGLTPDNIMVKKISTSTRFSTGGATQDNGSPPPPLSNQYEVKLMEFGLATTNMYNSKGGIKHLSDHPLFEWNDVLYMPPEAILGHPYSVAVDMWSLGVLMFLMLSGELPFNQSDDKLLVNAIKVSLSLPCSFFNVLILSC